MPTATVITLVLLALGSLAGAEDAAPYRQTLNVVYAETAGVGLLMDVFSPTKPEGPGKGLGVVCVCSGGWTSDRGMVDAHRKVGVFDALCSHGYTVFAVRPGNYSAFTGEQMLAHTKRGIRYVKAHARDYGVDPQRLGLVGVSAGGHLACLAATRAEAGDPRAADPLNRLDTQVRAVGVFCPATDFLDWNGKKYGLDLVQWRLAFSDGVVGKMEQQKDDAAKAISPVYHVTAGLPPFFIVHGDADSVIPFQQSQELVNRGQIEITIRYALRKDQFWLERRIQASSEKLLLRRFIYGRLDTPGRPRVLELGKYDRPRIISGDAGGLFGGPGWWFYALDANGVYENRDVNYAVWRGRFESEPWYVGVFKTEPGEPYPGWLWYRSFLQMRKSAHDRQRSWSYWNAGWGQWGVEIDEPSAKDCLELARKLGVRSILFGSGGSGKGLRGYVESAKTSAVTRGNLDLAHKYGIGAGFLDSGGLKERWADPVAYGEKLRDLGESARAGYRAVHFDFFSTADTFTAHRNVSEYFRAAHGQMDFTECHLGMASYGPQLQREVLLNHPADLHGFDISRFSSDWTTFLGFRYSRAEWQKRYDYLMPEYGLYYFLTHYSNHGHPRRYTDPEPQQFLYKPHAYCGIGYNFHDALGFREVLAAATAFTPYYVFGHLDLKMPEQDIAYAAQFLKWVEENVELLRLGRVCFEDSDACVVSKMQGGKGVIYCLNYSPGARRFRLELRAGGEGPLKLQQVFPSRGREFAVKEGGEFVLDVKGESTVILNVNAGLKTLPPVNESHFPLDLSSWSQSGGSFNASFRMPDVRSLLPRAADPDLPARLLSLDEVQDSIPDLVDMIRVSPGSPPRSMLSWIGRGRLPAAFKSAYGFEGNTVETWRVAPWAFAGRVWLVYRPAKPVPLTSPFPRVEVNGKNVAFHPRVDYRGAEEKWSCPLFHADITNICTYGGVNEVRLAGVDAPGICYVTTAADRR